MPDAISATGDRGGARLRCAVGDGRLLTIGADAVV
jgi:hypothetical protein